MNSNNKGGMPVAPHGILCVAAFAMLILIIAHTAGFRAMGAVNFGKG